MPLTSPDHHELFLTLTPMRFHEHDDREGGDDEAENACALFRNAPPKHRSAHGPADIHGQPTMRG